MKKLGLIITGLITALVPGYASTNSCLATTATSTAHPNQVAGVAIAAGGSGVVDDFNSLNSAAVPGCSTVDLVFSNFTSTNSATDISGGTYISTLTNQDLSTNPVTAVFSTVRGADNGFNTGANDGTNNWVSTTGNITDQAIIDYQVVASGTSMGKFVLDLNGTQLGGGTTPGTITGSVNLCLGGQWSAGGTGSVCSSGNTQVITLVSGTTSYTLTLTTPTTSIGVQNVFNLFSGSQSFGAGTTFLTAFNETFDPAQAPEPSSYVFMGSALLGLGLLRFRLKRRRA